MNVLAKLDFVIQVPSSEYYYYYAGKAKLD
jgi:hypothetical protein